MARIYYQDEWVTLWHGDCLTVDAWLEADVLVTDPPYGIAWKKGMNRAAGSRAHAGIANDKDTSARDAALTLWGDRPAAVFGSFYAPHPPRLRHIRVWEKPQDAGVVGSTTGFRRDVEPIFMCGPWPKRPATRGSIVRSASANAGGASSPAGRYGHPHAKPLDLMEDVIDACPPGTIADPFAGSGSTLVAAKALGRKSVGVELDERYCEIAARRLAQDVLDFGALA